MLLFTREEKYVIIIIERGYSVRIDILADDIRQITDDNELSYIINFNGTYIAKQPTQERPKIYKIEIDDNQYHILGDDSAIYVNDKKIQRIDELVYLVFFEELIKENEILTHMDGNSLNDSRDNLKVTTLTELIQLQDINYEVDESLVLKDVLKLKSKSQEIENRYNELVNALKKNPYKLPPKFTPTNGLLYSGHKGLYHAVIDKSLGDRVFYRIKSNKIIIGKVDIKGVVKILQALGHDWNKANDIDINKEDQYD